MTLVTRIVSYPAKVLLAPAPHDMLLQDRIVVDSSVSFRTLIDHRLIGVDDKFTIIIYPFRW